MMPLSYLINCSALAWRSGYVKRSSVEPVPKLAFSSLCKLLFPAHAGEHFPSSPRVLRCVFSTSSLCHLGT